MVGTQTGGIPELLEGGAGLIVPDKDPAALADAIERYIRDPAFAAEVGRQGKAEGLRVVQRDHGRFPALERILPSHSSPRRRGAACRKGRGSSPWRTANPWSR